MISSSLVRDLYQRTVNPDVSPRAIKAATYVVTALVGLAVTVVALNPPGYLQYLIVFTGSGQGCAFLLPMALALYWPRATRAGVLAAMLGGFLAVVSLYGVGWLDNYVQGEMRPYLTQAAPERPQPAGLLDDTLGWVPGWGEPRHDGFAPLYVGGFDPLVWGLLASLVLGVGVSLLTRPDPELVRKYFP
jgi:Na+/proline symporter